MHCKKCHYPEYACPLFPCRLQSPCMLFAKPTLKQSSDFHLFQLHGPLTLALLCHLRTSAWHRINPVLIARHRLSSMHWLHSNVELVVHREGVLHIRYTRCLRWRWLWRKVRRCAPFRKRTLGRRVGDARLCGALSRSIGPCFLAETIR